MERIKNKIIVFLFSLLIIFLSIQTTISFAQYSPQQQNAVEYLNGKTELVGNYTAGEHAHMADVQQLLSRGKTLFLLVCGVLLFLFSRDHPKRKEMSRIFLWSGITIISSLTLLLISSLISFTTIFTLFHTLFFPQGNWQFPVDSALIQTFPLSFFTKMSFFIFLQAFSWGILFILLALYVSYADTKKHA